MTRVAIMADETGWLARQLQAALRARGALGTAASTWRIAGSTPATPGATS